MMIPLLIFAVSLPAAEASADEARIETKEQFLARLVRQFKGKNPEVARRAAESLLRLGPRAKSVAAAVADTVIDGTENKEAGLILAAMGPDAVPVMIKAFNRRNCDAAWMCWAFGVMGPPAGRAVPLLNRMLSTHPDPHVREVAAESLGNIGPAAAAAVPALITALADESWMLRSNAAKALGKIGPAAKPAVPALIELLRKPGSQYPCADAAQALGRIRLEPELAVPALIEALERGLEPPSGKSVRDPAEVRRMEWIADPAITALREFGPSAKAAVPVLIEMMKRRPSDRGPYAAEAIGKIGPEAKSAIPALVDLLKAGNRYDFMVIEALAVFGPEAKSALPELLRRAAADDNPAKAAVAQIRFDELLRESAASDRAVRLRAVRLLRLAGERGAPARIAAAKDADDEIRLRAVEGLGDWFPDTPENREAAVVALAGALKDRDAKIRAAAAGALRQIPRGAGKPAFAALVAALRDPDGGVRCRACEALECLGPDGRPAIPAIIPLLKSEDFGDRMFAGIALRMGAGDKAAVEALAAALRDVNEHVRESAAESLREIGPSAGAAVPELIAAASDAKKEVRCAAMQALGRMGPRPDAVPALIRGLKDPEKDNRWVAADALARIGPPARPALAALRELAADPDYGLSQKAAEAIENILVPAG